MTSSELIGRLRMARDDRQLDEDQIIARMDSMLSDAIAQLEQYEAQRGPSTRRAELLAVATALYAASITDGFSVHPKDCVVDALCVIAAVDKHMEGKA